MGRSFSLREREPGKYDIVIRSGNMSSVLTFDGGPLDEDEVFSLREVCNWQLYHLPEPAPGGRKDASPARLRGLQPG